MLVELAFDLTVNGGGAFFTLDDSIKGELDNLAYTLAGGDSFVDVTNDVRSVMIKRGRSAILEKVTAGIAGITLDNRQRTYDPLYVDGPWYGQIGPRKQVRVSVEGERLFEGNIEDWDYSYTLAGDSVADVQCIDAFGFIAGQDAPIGAKVAQLPGARLGAILDGIGYPSVERSISTGSVDLTADVVDAGTNALAYVEQVSLSEPGLAYISRDGQFTFKDRTDLQSYTSGVTFGDGGIPMSDIGVLFGTDELVNTVNVVWAAGTATAANASAAVEYGTIDRTINTLIADGNDAQDYANWLVNQYGLPKYRFDSVSVVLEGLSSSQRRQVLSLDLGDTVTVSWTPNAVGSTISQLVSIDAIEHQASPASHVVTLKLSQTVAAFLLDDSVYGSLNNNTLGF